MNDLCCVDMYMRIDYNIIVLHNTDERRRNISV